MVLASEIKEGAAIQWDGKLYKVLEVIRHAGSGQMHGFIELKLKDIRSGHCTDKHFKQTEKIDTIDLVKKQMDFLYADADTCYFMNPINYEQVGVPKTTITVSENFLKEGMRIILEMIGDETVSLHVDKVIELRVASTPPGIHEAQMNTMKTAVLENGVQILVPQFVEIGDIVRVDTEKIKYIDRVPLRKM
jgi:elongation factor P